MHTKGMCAHWNEAACLVVRACMSEMNDQCNKQVAQSSTQQNSSQHRSILMVTRLHATGLPSHVTSRQCIAAYVVISICYLCYSML